MYDGKQHTEFMDKLEERIRVHDRDIERMCNYHYQGFIESVNELLKVRGEARKLKVCSYSVALSANSTETPYPTCAVVILTCVVSSLYVFYRGFLSIYDVDKYSNISYKFSCWKL